jgi:putative SOS response-associated peptidase YedK
MCGRFTLHAEPEVVTGAMAVPDLPPYRPLYNIAPTAVVLTVGLKPDGNTRGWGVFKWGLVPRWAPDVKSGPANARADTVATLPTFREAFAKRRCLVVADGFYE